MCACAYDPGLFLVDREGRYVSIPLGNPQLLDHAITALLDRD